MNFEDRLRRYRENLFTDDDVTRCTGLTVRAWRELIKVRAVHTVTEGRGPGRVRVCDATVLKRAAVIAALNQAGLSLAVSGSVAYCLPFHTVLYELCDPARILPTPFERHDHHRPEAAKATDGAPVLGQLHATVDVNWFDPNQPGNAEPKTDWLIDVFDNRFVGVRYQVEDKPAIFGDLRAGRTSFVAWLPLHSRAQFARSAIADLAQERLPSPNQLVDFVVDWEDPVRWPKELVDLGYRYENHVPNDDPLRVAAGASARSPVTTATINVSLAIRRALRRYLDIDTAAPGIGAV